MQRRRKKTMLIILILMIISATWAQNNPDAPFYIDFNNTNRPSNSSPSNVFTVPTLVYNVFPDINVTAVVVFVNDRISRLQYGQLYFIDATYEPSSDFLIQFRQVVTDAVQNGYTDFGFIEPTISEENEVVLIIRRDSDNQLRPRHHLLVFDPKSVNIETSRLYIYNAIWNRNNNGTGLYFYGLYQQRNTSTNGSESESITQLAVNLQMNTGIEINIQPNTRIDIKAFYSSVSSVSQFKSTPNVIKYENYIANNGQRRYLLAYGDYTRRNDTNEATRPSLCLVFIERSTERPVPPSNEPVPPINASGEYLKNIFIITIAIPMTVLLLLI